MGFKLRTPCRQRETRCNFAINPGGRRTPAISRGRPRRPPLPTFVTSVLFRGPGSGSGGGRVGLMRTGHASSLRAAAISSNNREKNGESRGSAQPGHEKAFFSSCFRKTITRAECKITGQEQGDN